MPLIEEIAAPTPDPVRAEMDRIKRLFADKNGEDGEDLISYAGHVIRLRNDLGILLAQIDSLSEATGESLDCQDAALVTQIRAGLAQSQ